MRKSINILLAVILFGCNTLYAQQKQNSDKFKKRVLENVEIDMLMSYYEQNGDHAAVSGGIGDEYLDDTAGDISIAIPLSPDDILTVGYTISAYTSASSSNLNPFSGASRRGDDDENENEDDFLPRENRSAVTGTPWMISSGASREDVWQSGSVSYARYSKDRNKIISANLNMADEFDYASRGLGVGYSYLFNRKNSEISLHLKAYFDYWKPQYPTEIKTYIKNGGNLYTDFFANVQILDKNGNAIDKNAPNGWKPLKNELISTDKRNSYTLSLSFSQILNKRAQISLITDITYQEGWLANPMQRVYFSDRPDFYIGNPSDISHYTSRKNKGVFQLADDIERLPQTRLKIPLGIRLNYYVNEFLVVNSFYRYYYDDWGIFSHTYQIEIPVKWGMHFTFYPGWRYYTQTASKYFAPFEQHLSNEKYYTSDYDLSGYNAVQYSFGIKYSNALAPLKWWKIGLKNIVLRYGFYKRTNIPFQAHIVTLGMKWIFEK